MSRVSYRFILLTLLLTTLLCCESPVTRSGYTEEEIDYFLEIALGTEYGDVQPVIRKWRQDLKIKLMGTPSDTDMKTLDDVLKELNGIIDGVSLWEVEGQPNVEIHFLPEEEFSQIEPNYVPLNYGFFWVQWNGDGELTFTRILIATDELITQTVRSHLLREELTQSLGLMRDSNRYRDSIFYQGFTNTTSYSEIDKVVIEILYLDEIRTNMTEAEVRQVLSG